MTDRFPMVSFPLPALAVLVIVLAGATPAPSSPQAPQAKDDLTASIRSVDVAARRLEVLTGVGYALRVRAIEVAPACEIKVEGASASLAQLKSGQVVHIRYHKTDGTDVALAIETVSMPAAGGER